MNVLTKLGIDAVYSTQPFTIKSIYSCLNSEGKPLGGIFLHHRVFEIETPVARIYRLNFNHTDMLDVVVVPNHEPIIRRVVPAFKEITSSDKIIVTIFLNCLHGGQLVDISVAEDKKYASPKIPSISTALDSKAVFSAFENNCMLNAKTCELI